jgi:hypothetical protein
MVRNLQMYFEDIVIPNELAYEDRNLYHVILVCFVLVVAVMFIVEL